MNLSLRPAPAALLAAAVLVLATACGSGGSAGEEGADSVDDVTLKVGLPTKRFGASWDFSGLDLPYKVEITTFDTATAEVAALQSGSIDLANVGDLSAIASQAAGADLRIIGEWRGAGTALQLVVPKDSDARSIADLRGRRIAVTQNSVGHRMLLTQIAAAGLAPADYRITFLSPADGRTAFQSGSVDAWASSPPGPTIAQVESGARQIAHYDGDFNAYIVTRSDLVSDPAGPRAAAAADFVSQWARVFDKEKTDQAGWAAAFAAALNVKPEVAAIVVKDWQFTIAPIDARSSGDYDKAAQFLLDAGVIASKPDPSKYFDDYANGAVEKANSGVS